MFGPKIVSSLQASFTTFRETEVLAKPAAPGAVGGGATSAFSGTVDVACDDKYRDPEIQPQRVAPSRDLSEKPPLNISDFEEDEFVFIDDKMVAA